ncbi:hypothetical protein [Loigolactobacillus coryniformis]|uniref:hypothetical protein n=1 Tax=Loigolactobacillus coryniformis TaxID=1610 RepID=UPI00345CFDC4
MKKILVFDIGGTNLKYAVMTPQRALLIKGSVATPTAGLPQFIAMLQKIIPELSNQVQHLLNFTYKWSRWWSCE